MHEKHFLENFEESKNLQENVIYLDDEALAKKLLGAIAFFADIPFNNLPLV